MGEHASSPWPRPHPSLALLVAVAALLRIAQIDVGAHVDEVYHVLAALSWLEEGTFAVGEGSYTRTRGFTVLVAGSLGLLGDSLVAARIPALVFGLAWVALVFEWTRGVAGLWAAWVAGLLFAFDPGAIHLSQFARFYTLHGLLIWVGAAGVYWLVATEAATVRRGAVAAMSAVSLAAASYLQPVTGIGVAALLVWLTGRWVVSAGDESGKAAARLLAIAAAAAAVAGAAHLAGVLQEMWTTFRTPAEWAEPRADQWRFYHWWLEGRFPVLWRLYPLAALLSIRRHRRAAVFSVVMFAVPLLLHSLAGPKHERYLYYAMPFFFVTWGLVLSSALTAIRSAARRFWEAVEVPGLGPRWVRGLTGCAVAVALAFPVYTSPAFKTTVGMVTDDGPDRPYGQPEWTAAAAELRPLAEGKEVVIAARAAKAMYYLGRTDAEVLASPPVSSVLRPVDGIVVDGRIGVPVVHTESVLSEFLRCHRSGLVVVERPSWAGLERADGGTLAERIRDATEEVPVPGERGLVVRQWSDRSGAREADCASVRAVTARTSPVVRAAGRRR